MAKHKRVKRVNGEEPLFDFPEIPKGVTLVIDKKNYPVVGIFGRSVEINHHKEFAALNGMAINQSAVFKTDKKKIIDAIRARIHKLTAKRFVVRKITADVYRVWRVKDNAKINRGGRIAGGSPSKKGWSRVAKDQQNPDGTKKKGTWGGPRKKGETVTTTENQQS